MQEDATAHVARNTTENMNQNEIKKNVAASTPLPENTKGKGGLNQEQKAIVDAMMNRQVFVRAGAGTGKTFTMVEGIVQKLREHLADDKNKDSNFFDQVFMITFTNNAAAELKTRLRAKLLADEDEMVRSQVDLVENAWVSTIHGLCSRILREHALEANVDPQFEICTESQRSILLQQACDEVCQELREDERFAKVFDFYGYKNSSDKKGSSAPEMALAIAELMSANVDSANIQWVPLDEENAKRVLANNPQKIHDTWAAFIDFCEHYPEKKRIDDWRDSIEAYRNAFKTYEPMMLDSKSWKTQFFAFANVDMPNGRRFTKEGGADLIETIRTLTAEYLVCAISYYYQEPLKAPLYELGARIKQRFDELKQEEGLLDNNDLLERCYTYLAEQRPRGVCGKFRLAIVDEFQDTNEQQLQIIELLAHDDAALCFVGDAQQSIYRFRGADLDLYQKVGKKALNKTNTNTQGKTDEDTSSKEEEQKKDHVFQLKTNFRSHENVLAFVESLSHDPAVIPDFLSLTIPEKKHQKESSSIEKHIQKSPYWGNSRIFLEYTIAKNTGTSNRHISASNSQVAARIKDIIEKSNGHIKEKDIAVLTTTAKDVDKICRTLNTLGISAMRVNQDIQSVEEYSAINILLLALANPLDTKNAVLPLLMGPLFEVPANDLALISRASCPLDLLDVFYLSSAEAQKRCDENLDLRTCRAFDILSSLRAKAKQMSVSQLVEYVIRQSGWLHRIADDEATKNEKAANVYRVINVLKEIVDDEGYGIAKAPELFSLWMHDEKGRASLLNSSETGAVTVETIHQSKGLQYPVVVVAPQAFMGSRSDKPLLVTSFNGKSYLALKPSLSPRQLNHVIANDISKATRAHIGESFYKHFEKNKRSLTGAYLQSPKPEEGALATYKKTLASLKPLTARDAYHFIQLIEDDADNAETWRKIYVAMTRAESGLVIGLPQKLNKNAPAAMGTFVERFQDVLELKADATPEVTTKALQINKQTNSTAYLEAEYGNAQSSQESDSLNVTVRKDLFDPSTFNAEETSANELIVPAFKIYAEHEAPLPKTPWRAMSDVGSYSSDAHQQTQVEAAEKSANGDMYRYAHSYGSREEEIPANTFEPFDHNENDSHSLMKDEQGLPERATGKDALRFGTAFHTLAELSVLTRKEPTKEQIQAQASLNQLNGKDTEELEKAMHAWWNSSLRAEAFAFPHVRAEYPFFMQADAQSNHAYNRGFIDLLAHDGKKAIVIDYKTGEQDLSEKEARKRHAMQGEWYARALLNSGFEEVTVKFIHVQNERYGTPLVIDFGAQTKESLTTTFGCN